MDTSIIPSSPSPHYLPLPLTTSRARPLVSTTRFQYAHSFIPTWFHHPALSLSYFFSYFFFFFFISSPSLLPPPFSCTRARLGSTGPTCCSRVRAITISNRAFFATSRVLTSSLEEEMNWVIVKSCPGCNCKRVPGPATRDRVFLSIEDPWSTL